MLVPHVCALVRARTSAHTSVKVCVNTHKPKHVWQFYLTPKHVCLHCHQHPASIPQASRPRARASALCLCVCVCVCVCARAREREREREREPLESCPHSRLTTRALSTSCPTSTCHEPARVSHKGESVKGTEGQTDRGTEREGEKKKGREREREGEKATVGISVILNPEP